MAAGEHGGHAAVATRPERELAEGEAVTASGRISAARPVDPQPDIGPFSPVQLAQIDEALTLSSRMTGLDFSVYLGDLGSDTRATAESLHASIGPGAEDAVLLAVSPGQRVVEVLTGKNASRRVPDRDCKLAVMSMVASFKEGDLAGGIVSGLRMLTDAAGPQPRT